VPGRLDRHLEVLEVEALFRGELHELSVLGVAKRSEVVLLARALGVDGGGWSTR
jgi:hypothetical protein